MIKPEKASSTLRFAFSANIGNRRILCNEQREQFTSKTLVESEVPANRNDLVIGMGSHNDYTLFLEGSQLGGHTMREAVNPSKETNCRALKHAFEEFRSLHFGTSLIRSA